MKQVYQNSCPTSKYAEVSVYPGSQLPGDDSIIDFYEDKGNYLIRIGIKEWRKDKVTLTNDTLFDFSHTYGTYARYANHTFLYAGFGQLKIDGSIYDSVSLMITTLGANTEYWFYQTIPYYHKLMVVEWDSAASKPKYITLWQPTEYTSINKVEEQCTFSIFPNPNKGNFNISFNSNEQKIIRVFDVLGSLVYTTSTNQNKINIDLPNAQKGFYFIHIQTENSQSYSKILVE